MGFIKMKTLYLVIKDIFREIKNYFQDSFHDYCYRYLSHLHGDIWTIDGDDNVIVPFWKEGSIWHYIGQAFVKNKLRDTDEVWKWLKRDRKKQ